MEVGARPIDEINSVVRDEEGRMRLRDIDKDGFVSTAFVGSVEGIFRLLRRCGAAKTWQLSAGNGVGGSGKSRRKQLFLRKADKSQGREVVCLQTTRETQLIS